MDIDGLKLLNRRLMDIRSGLLRDYPFFGRLLLRLPVGFSDCGTAFTDMRRIVFDPAFAQRLSDDELRFVFLHELYHCILHHCTRGRGRDRFLYNVACDIVVNSFLLEMLAPERRGELILDGSPVMHRTPKGDEGRLYGAEEVYDMLLDGHGPPPDGRGTIDDHGAWAGIAEPGLDEVWDHHIRRAARACADSGSGIPRGLRRHLKELVSSSKVDWRTLLHDFLRFDSADYEFSRPDRRFQGDIIMPSFREDIAGAKAERLWFAVDTSGSISDEALSEAMGEIRSAMDQIGNLSGALSFFDTRVSEPAAFDSVEVLAKLRPVGGGGTSFSAIFQAMPAFFSEELPAAVIVMTDGYSLFPAEEAALGVPVLWIMVNSEVEAPWGLTIHIWDDT